MKQVLYLALTTRGATEWLSIPRNIKVIFKDKPDVWHELPVTKKGLMMITLTKEAL